MSGYSLSMADEAVITDLLAKNARLEEEIEYLRNEIISMKTGPHSELLKVNRKLRHELAVLAHGIDGESERLREELAVKLELTLGAPFDHTIAMVWTNDITNFTGSAEKEGDIYAAIRRAIVKAAANIGKEMK